MTRRVVFGVVFIGLVKAPPLYTTFDQGCPACALTPVLVWGLVGW